MSFFDIFRSDKNKKKSHPAPNQVPKHKSQQIQNRLEKDVLRAGLYDSDVQAIKTNLESILAGVRTLGKGINPEIIKNIETKIGEVYQELLNAVASGEKILELVGAPEDAQKSVFSEFSKIGSKVQDSERNLLKTINNKDEAAPKKIAEAVKTELKPLLESLGGDGGGPGKEMSEKLDKLLIGLRALSEKQDNSHKLVQSLNDGKSLMGGATPVAVERTSDIWQWHREKDANRRDQKVILIIPESDVLTEGTIHSFLEVNTYPVNESRAAALCAFVGVPVPALADEAPKLEQPVETVARGDEENDGAKLSEPGSSIGEVKTGRAEAASEAIDENAERDQAGDKNTDVPSGDGVPAGDAADSTGAAEREDSSEPASAVNESDGVEAVADAPPAEGGFEKVDEQTVAPAAAAVEQPAKNSRGTESEAKGKNGNQPKPSGAGSQQKNSQKPPQRNREYNHPPANKPSKPTGYAPIKTPAAAKGESNGAAPEKSPEIKEKIEEIKNNINPEESASMQFLFDNLDLSGTVEHMGSNSQMEIVPKQ